jgi:demethylmenaquinone methyltransferase/2-methoxy-6-polyprenyl-1,4-benzoquinol methylase
VTKPGGRLVVCEFSSPTWSPFRTVYLASNPEAYVYLAESIRAWPDQPGLAARIEEAGWTACRWRNLSGGIVALHHATA